MMATRNSPGGFVDAVEDAPNRDAVQAVRQSRARTLVGITVAARRTGEVKSGSTGLVWPTCLFGATQAK
jgi:hypothetical protein